MPCGGCVFDDSKDRNAPVSRVPIWIAWVMNWLGRKEGVGCVGKSEEIWSIRHTHAV